MARRSIWLLWAVFTLCLAPMLQPADGQVCKFGMQVQMQQKAHYAYQMHMQQQAMHQMRVQQQVQHMQQMRMQQQAQHMAAMRPKFTPRPPVVHHIPKQQIHIQPPALNMMKHQLVQQQKMQKMMQHKLVQQKITTMHAPRHVPGFGAGMKKPHVPHMNTHLVQQQMHMEKHQLIKQQKMLTTRKSFKPPAIQLTIPGSRALKKQKAHLVQKMEQRGRQLVLPELKKQRQMQTKLMVETKKQEKLITKKTLVVTNTPIIKMNMSCINCHKKMNIHPNPVGGSGPGLMQMVGKKPGPLPNPLPGCPPGIPAMNQPIGFEPPRMPIGIGPGGPFNLPIPIAGGPFGPSFRNPWMDGPSKFASGVTGPKDAGRKQGPKLPEMQNMVAMKEPGKNKKPANAKEPVVDWQTPVMPALTKRESQTGELFLLHPIAPARSRRGTPANEVSAPIVDIQAASLPSIIDLDGPALPPLPRSARVLDSTKSWSGAAKDEDWYSAQVAPRSARAGNVATTSDISPPALPPLASRVLLPD